MPEEETKDPNPEQKREKAPSRLTSEDIKEYLQSTEQTTEPQNILMQWEAPEFKQVSRPRQWYILFGIVGVAIAIFAVITANYLFALIIVLLAVVLNSFFSKKPKKLSFAITPEGIVVNKKLYVFGQEVQSFWILYDPPNLKSLHFGKRSSLQPSITVELQDQNPLKVREILLNYLPEDVEREEHPVDSTFRNWGF
ncbi:hypothetical protein KKH43_01910 [Patescibacteria group bacterium]|nr:hypothetical protein [Patescibacteria group bacterium]